MKTKHATSTKPQAGKPISLAELRQQVDLSTNRTDRLLAEADRVLAEGRAAQARALAYFDEHDPAVSERLRKEDAAYREYLRKL